ncbi:heavy-metal-associated domain-containing protein [Roseospira marina]|uniref:heavy-metal-associated domain-containing protein n=1 Tax=Roseospira marina TaxID=140057 RepID=UPI00160E0838|nr:heavy-metal-associated domain-containing protein [Roseospira marina]MBB4314695.1 hypothetical protein [Roseospira marina]MBB5087684.1 hypothetical protein [Roseospira marina]
MPAFSDPSSGLVDLFLRLRPHLTLVHHVPGRVRLRVGAGALAVLPKGGASLDALAPLFAPGTIRLNPAARSVVITHDPARFPPAFWQECLDGSDATARARLAAAFPDQVAEHPTDSSYETETLS